MYLWNKIYTKFIASKRIYIGGPKKSKHKGVMDRPDSPGGDKSTKERRSSNQLQSILVHHLEEEDFFHGQMRPRANTDPISPRPRLHVTFDLPDIVVDDCSDNDEDYLDCAHPEEINKDLRNTDEGAFFVFKSPPRQRANTCPMNMFSKRKPRRNRPATPPPKESGSQEFPRHPSWEKVTFSPHSLTSVEETREISRDTAQTSRTISPDSYNRSRKLGQTQPARGRQKGANESPSSSPKRTLSRLTNGHVTHKPAGHREQVIHSTA